MPLDSTTELTGNKSNVAARVSSVLAIIASVAVLGDLLLNSPSHFSERHTLDHSPLNPVVTLLGLGANFPTARGVEVRNLIFYSAAAVLAVVAGVRVFVSRRAPRLSADDLLDIRARAASPYFWWILLLLVSLLSSIYSHAPEVCERQVIIRCFHAAWWLPLAILLAPRDARRLAAWLFVAIAITAAIGLWYYYVRVHPFSPDARLQYPIGNELWLGACLLPGVFLGAGFAGAGLLGSKRDVNAHRPIAGATSAVIVAGTAIVFVALYLTRSRSAFAGLGAGGFALVIFATRGRTRQAALLVAVLVAAAGVFGVQRLRAAGVMGERAHSIRSRLNYEWPYALLLLSQKPLTGHGDGAFAMLAGQLAREDQLDDPGVIRFDEWSWMARAHNEFLELAADLGVIGAAAFAIAIGLTLWRTVQFCDRRRGDATAGFERWLTIGLAAALAAMVVEECGSPALREPGFPPVFLTVWAVLWSLVRVEQPVPQSAPAEERITGSMMRLSGLVVAVGGALLAWQGVRDWQGARARCDAEKALKQRNYDEAVTLADRAAERLLDPFQNLLARMIGVWGRSLAFDERLRDAATAPTDYTLAIARDGLMTLNQLKRDAPRFLRVSRLESELYLNLARAAERRGDAASQREFHGRFVQALEENRRDEPFMFDRIYALWQARPEAKATERLLWLRCLLRNGEIDDGFMQLFESLRRSRDFSPALGDLVTIATQDAGRAPEAWQDKLSPETLRVQALATALAGRPAEASSIASRAAGMYAMAGPRLFTAHGAVLHERVRYSFSDNPTARVDENLEMLANAFSIVAARVDPRTALPDVLGQTRLRVLLAAGREKEAEEQIAKLGNEEKEPMTRRLAMAYREMAEAFLNDSLHADLARKWMARANELAPERGQTRADEAGHAVTSQPQ